MVKVHIDNTRHITVANIYIYTSSKQHIHTQKLADTNITLYTVHHKHTTLSPHRRCECRLHSLVVSYTDDHRGQLIPYTVYPTYQTHQLTELSPVGSFRDTDRTFTSRQFYYKPLFCNNLVSLYIISVSEILHLIKSKSTDQFSLDSL